MIVRQFARYLVAGGTAVGVHLSILTALTELFHVRPAIATAVGFVAGSVVNYVLQQRWVFQAQGDHRGFASRYALITTGTFFLNMFLFWVAHNVLHVWYLAAQVLVTGFIFLINFVLNRWFTFRVHLQRAG